MNGDDTRTRILMCLIDNAEEMTLADISNKMDLSHQLVRYHLPYLLDMGLILKENNKYFCQPAFLDPDIQQASIEAYTDFVLNFMKNLYLDFDKDNDKIEALLNCLLTQMMLTHEDMKRLIKDRM